MNDSAIANVDSLCCILLLCAFEPETKRLFNLVEAYLGPPSNISASSTYVLYPVLYSNERRFVDISLRAKVKLANRIKLNNTFIVVPQTN